MSFAVPVQQQKEMDYHQIAPVVPPPGAVAVPPPQLPVGVMQGTLQHPQPPQPQPQPQHHPQTEEQRMQWTQYQQLWRQHVYMNGTTRGGGGDFRDLVVGS
nr:unnamed protein product [Callosobruchus chinensis]